MTKSWKDLTLEEAVERAKGISRQALHIAIKTYVANGQEDVAQKLRDVRKTLKRDNRIAKVGKEAVEAVETKRQNRATWEAEFKAAVSAPIVGYEEKWAVTKDGRIWSHIHHKWLKPHAIQPNKKSNKHYLYIGRGTATISVHREVAKAFVPNPENRRNVRHKDGNTSNNNASNLEWWGKKLDK